MGLGVLEGEPSPFVERLGVLRPANTSAADRSNLQNVPGTVLLNDAAAHADDAVRELKHGTGKNAHIVLSPQPSEDPNDPRQ